MVTWTRFYDMHSGGGLKEDFSIAYIEAPEDEAKAVFYSRFGHSADRITCTCCGEDYSVSTDPTLEAATEYERTHSWDSSLRADSLEEFVANPNVLVIRADEIEDHERISDIPEQGWVWQD